MSEREKKKRTLICLSEDEATSEEDDDDNDDADDEGSFSDTSEYGSDDLEAEEDKEESQSDDNDDDDDSLCGRVVRIIKEEGDLGPVSVKECKAYLRKHGLRVSGTKTICIQRIKEHWRIKDGNGEILYPKPSFNINCTGDVCQGDVVLFTQKVYKKFHKVTRNGRWLGRRTVAGRVVHESYGAAKQQHTFTIEVLWTKGISKLPPLFPLLVKGRNLYRMRSFRQQWNNEAERLKVLDEKHKRGTVARHIRATKKAKNTESTKRAECHKHSYHSESSKKRKKAEPENGKSVFGHGKSEPWQCGKSENRHQEAPSTRNLNLKGNARSADLRLPQRREIFHYFDYLSGANLQSYTPHSHYPSQIDLHHRYSPSFFSSHGVGPTSVRTRLPQLMPYPDTFVMPDFQRQWFNHSNCTQLANSNHFPDIVNVDRLPGRPPYGTDVPGLRRSGFPPALYRQP